MGLVMNCCLIPQHQTFSFKDHTHIMCRVCRCHWYGLIGQEQLYSQQEWNLFVNHDPFCSDESEEFKLEGIKQ
jgi:hypothetical protein